jgi:hypothetical protein
MFFKAILPYQISGPYLKWNSEVCMAIMLVHWGGMNTHTHTHTHTHGHGNTTIQYVRSIPSPFYVKICIYVCVFLNFLYICRVTHNFPCRKNHKYPYEIQKGDKVFI